MAGKTCKGAGTHLSNHATPGFVALTVGSPLLLLLQYPFPTSPILKGKLSQCVTELHDTNVPRCLCSVAQVEQEGMEPKQFGRSGRLDSESSWGLRDGGGNPTSLWLLAPPVADSTVYYS